MVAEHGTNARYNWHTGTRTPPCEPCKAAHRAYMDRYRQRRYLARGDLMVPAFRVKRRVRALLRMGWTKAIIASVAKPTLRSGADWLEQVMKSENVTPATFEAIDKAYRELSHKRGPSQKNATFACNRGWPPPAAWDDIDNEDCKAEGYLRPSDYRKLKDTRA